MPPVLHTCRENAQTDPGVRNMAKQGMKRPQIHKGPPKNEAFVPELQGKDKSGKKKVNPIIAGTMGAELKVWHEKSIPDTYGVIDNDLARDNLENDIPLADLQDI